MLERRGDRAKRFWAKRPFKWRQQLRSTLLLGLGLAIALIAKFPASAVAQSATAAVTSPPAEIRGVWLTNVDSDVLLSRNNLRQGIRRLARLNFNTIYPTIWNGGYTLYPSTVAKQASGDSIDPEFQGRDMLAEAITIGHNQGLTVIPWLEFGLMAPADSSLVQRHPDWVTTRQNGSSIFNVHGHDRSVWLNPVHPEVQRFLVDLVTEVVRKYDLDGIQLDDHFGMPVEVGYDPYTVKLYIREHQGKLPPKNPQDPGWMQWRASKLSGLMAQIYSAVKTHKPNCLLSLSPNPKDFAYRRTLQDWFSWQRLGLLDELIVQVYRSDVKQFVAQIDRPELQTIRRRIPVGIGVLTGLSLRNVEMEDIQDQVRLVRDRRYAGVSFFFYGTLGDRDASFEALFPGPANRPDLSAYSARG